MAITDAQKLDYLWKKLGYGVTKTDVNSIKNATNESIASPLLLRGDKLWTEASAIPATKPNASTSIVEIYDDTGNGTATVECSADTTASANRTWKTNLTDWIPPEFGATYQLKVYMDNAGASTPETTGTQLFAAGSGNNDQWFFDYQSGVVHFIGTNLPTGIAGKAIYVVGARYIGQIGNSYSSLSIGNFNITNNTIESTNTDGEIILDPNGTGDITLGSDRVIAGNTSNTSVNHSMNVLSGTSTDSFPTELFMSGNTRINLPNNTTMMFEADIVGRQQNGTNHCAFRLQGVIDNTGGTTVIVNTVNETIVAETNDAWAVEATADDTNDTVVIKVYGVSSTTIKWVAFVKTTAITH